MYYHLVAGFSLLALVLTGCSETQPTPPAISSDNPDTVFTVIEPSGSFQKEPDSTDLRAQFFADFYKKYKFKGLWDYFPEAVQQETDYLEYVLQETVGVFKVRNKEILVYTYIGPEQDSAFVLASNGTWSIGIPIKSRKLRRLPGGINIQMLSSILPKPETEFTIFASQKRLLDYGEDFNVPPAFYRIVLDSAQYLVAVYHNNNAMGTTWKATFAHVFDLTDSIIIRHYYHEEIYQDPGMLYDYNHDGRLDLPTIVGVDCKHCPIKICGNTWGEISCKKITLLTLYPDGWRPLKLPDNYGIYFYLADGPYPEAYEYARKWF